MNDILIFSIFLLAGLPFSSSSDYCASVCTSKFHRGIAEITGLADTTTLLAPFHRIITKVEDNKVAHKQIRVLCSKVKGWDTCIRSCQLNSARQILLSSMEQWKRFCSIMRKPNRATIEFMNCERDHQGRVEQHCRSQMPHTHMISVFCDKFQRYHECSSRQEYYCSDEAVVLKMAIDKAVEKSFHNLMKFAKNRINIPSKCNMYHRPHHKPKIHRGEMTTTSTTTHLPLISEVTIYEVNVVPTTPLTTTLEYLIENSSLMLDQAPEEKSVNASIQHTKETQSLVNSYPKKLYFIFQISIILYQSIRFYY